MHSNVSSDDAFVLQDDGAVQFARAGVVDVHLVLHGTGTHRYRYLIGAINQDCLPNTDRGAGDPSAWHFADCRCEHGPVAIAFTASVRAGDRFRAATVPAHSNLGLVTHASRLAVTWRETW